MPIQSKADYKIAFALVQEVVSDWDPYSLIAAGAPSNEFDMEVAKVLARVPTILSEDDAATVLASVFRESFEPDQFSVESCAEVGRSLFLRLQAAGFLPENPEAAAHNQTLQTDEPVA